MRRCGGHNEAKGSADGARMLIYDFTKSKAQKITPSAVQKNVVETNGFISKIQKWTAPWKQVWNRPYLRAQT